MDNHPRPHNYDAFLVRIWRDSQETPWRASVQTVEDGRTIHFNNLQAVYAFLELRSIKRDLGKSDSNSGSR
jgi:hypothetical protein